MEKSRNIITLALGFLALMLLAYLIFYQPKEVVVTKVVRDTTIITKVDTIIERKPMPYEVTKLDTVYQFVTGADVLSLPMVQHRYFKEGAYDVYISGVNPTLDSILTFTNTKHQVITNTIDNIVYKNIGGIYLNAGVTYYNSKYSPSVGVEWVTNKKINLGVNVSLIESKPIIFATFGFKIK